MSIKSEIKEEREAWILSGKSVEDYYKNQKEKYTNTTYKPIKKVMYKGVELSEDDIIVNNNQLYIIVDFTKNLVPIVDLHSIKQHNYYSREWEFGSAFRKLNNVNFKNKLL